MKLLIIGHARHGKDTVAEFLKRDFHFQFKSSSIAASEIFLFDALKDKYGYTTPEECFEDRVNHRAEWHDLIVDYNRENPSRLAEEIFKDNEIYVGMRSGRELKDCREKELIDIIIGVWDNRKPEEPKDSFDIDFWNECDIIIPNSGSLNDLEKRVILLGSMLFNTAMITE